MVALWNRADHYIFILFLSSFFFFSSSPNLVIILFQNTICTAQMKGVQHCTQVQKMFWMTERLLVPALHD